MIAYIRGILIEKEPSFAVIEAAGIGYEMTIPLSTFDRLPNKGSEAKLLTVHVVREDDEALYGFATEGERTMFRKLVSVAGVGPKMAVAILSGCSIGELSLAIANGNARRLASVKGVGKKTAEKICVELKDKVSALEALAQASAGGEARAPWLRDAVLALTALGFGDDVASRKVADVVAAHPEAKDVESVVRLALKGA